MAVRAERTFIERIDVCSTFSSEGRVLRGCACGRVVGHSFDGAQEHLRCVGGWQALLGSTLGARGAQKRRVILRDSEWVAQMQRGGDECK